MKLKRDNWTNEEVIKLIRSQKLCGEAEDHHPNWNDGIEAAAQQFEDFSRPAEQFGALAYDSETDTIYQVGKIPEESTS